MEKFIVTTGKTIDLAVAAALKELNLDRDNLAPRFAGDSRRGLVDAALVAIDDRLDVRALARGRLEVHHDIVDFGAVRDGRFADIAVRVDSAHGRNGGRNEELLHFRVLSVYLDLFNHTFSSGTGSPAQFPG